MSNTQRKIIFSLILVYLLLSGCGPAPEQRPNGSQEEGGRLVLSLPRHMWRDSFPSISSVVHIFTMNQDGTDLQPLIEGFDRYNFVVGISPERQQLLIASFFTVYNPRSVGTLYLVNIDGSDALKLTEGFPLTGIALPTTPAALWLSERNEIAYIEKQQSGTTDILVLNLDNNETFRIPEFLNPPPYNLAGYTVRGELYWRTGFIADESDALLSDAFLIERSLWFYNLDTGYFDRAIDPDKFIFPHINISHVGNKSIAEGWLLNWDLEPIYNTGHKNSIAHWSPDGSKVLLIVCDTEKCWNPNGKYELVVGDSDFLITSTIPLEANGAILAVDWHPDQDKVLLSIYAEAEQGMTLVPHVLDLETMTIEPLMENLEVVNSWFYPLWLP